MTTATVSKALGLELRGYDFMDLMRDAGMIPSKAPLPVAPAPRLADLMAQVKTHYRDWNYSFMDLVRDAGTLAPRPRLEAVPPQPLTARLFARQPQDDLPRAA